MSKSPVLELQELAQSDNTPIGELLRRASTIAAKLKLDDFRQWCRHELTGYPKDVDIPDYRDVHAQLHVMNPYHGLQPFILNDEKLEKILLQISLSTPVTELVDIVNKSPEGVNPVIPLDDREFTFLAKIVYESKGFHLQPVRTASITRVVQIFAAVRNTILEWTLQLEADGILGEGLQFTTREVQAAQEASHVTIGQLTHIGGNVSHSTLSQSQAIQVEAGSLPSLIGFLKSQGVDDDDLKLLRDAIENDPPKPDRGQLGSRVQSWLGAMLMKAASGAGMIGTGAGGNLLAEAIKAYYGWGL